MKKITVIICLVAFSELAAAQSGIVSGTIMNESGTPVSNASVLLQGTQTGVRTDSLGFFNININPNTTLIVSAAGYVADTINIININSKLAVVLKKNIITMQKVVVKESPQNNSNDPAGTMRNQSIGNALQDYVNTQTSTSMGMTRPNNLSTGAFLPQFIHHEDTKGTRYLFDRWVGGIVTDTGNNIIDNKNYLFNYDKVSRGILMAQDMKSAIEINKDQVKAFVLKDQNGNQYIFELASLINNGNFVEQLAKGNKYILYKSIKTKFTKANYHTDGMTESGNAYDEHVDEFHYYISAIGSKDYKEVEFKKKSIKAVLFTETDKLNNYFSQHSEDPIDETFLKGLITFLNQ